MNDTPRVSVVVASHGRPEALALCLKALRFQTYRPFEVIVVACAQGAKAVHDLPFHDQMKLLDQAEGGLSIARNQGISAAAGEIIAFLDDDAIADPPWLGRLVAGLKATGAAGTGGWVRSSNGISFEWTGGAVTDDLIWDRGVPTVMGTNMAFRADILRDLGGFDPSFAYYLDETDLTQRLAKAGQLVVPTPSAQVHHAGAPNAQRGQGRVPRSLAQIGKSEAIFLRRHAGDTSALARLRACHRQRLLRMMQTGPIGPEDVTRLMKDYDKGVSEGSSHALVPVQTAWPDLPEFLPFVSHTPKAPTYLGGRVWQRRAKLEEARPLALDDTPVSLFLFSSSTLYHRRFFTPDGLWIQTGGLFGRTGRTNPLAQMTGFSSRLKKEITRVAENFSD
ncbi:glycosyltransferase family 2 protein [Actibacterium pelagium]|uniref:Glycosyltransferase 2-like domain-containing protein n=1 Tax=Actibacterium pelagium TaxID=2029103 RepID=A0A917EMA5_9RHOB|nr:glycosyltransferase family 2 protein [Actibacterium pelagium]GGE56366.1 hypothetical protein GCM10011517_25090 [Actibacterium pelagium]